MHSLLCKCPTIRPFCFPLCRLTCLIKSLQSLKFCTLRYLDNGTNLLYCSCCIKYNLWNPLLAYISTRKSVNFNSLAYWWQTVHRLSFWHLQSFQCAGLVELTTLGLWWHLWLLFCYQGWSDVTPSFTTQPLDWRTLNVNSSKGLNICKIPHLLHMAPLIKPWINYKYLMMAYRTLEKI